MLTTRQKIAKMSKFLGTGSDVSAYGNIYGWGKEFFRDNMVFLYNIHSNQLKYKGWNNGKDNGMLPQYISLLEFSIEANQEPVLERIEKNMIRECISKAKDKVIEKKTRELLAEECLDFIATSDWSSYDEQLPADS
jgi:hypothetical protein